MMKQLSTFALSLSIFVAVAASAQIADQARDQTRTAQQTQTQDQERVYGSELMTPQERSEYHNRMRVLKTEQEREAFRLEHHKLMQERAKAQGKTLPDMPPAGMGPGKMGPGMGPGSGMGPGRR
jgi:hypothetical protein